MVVKIGYLNEWMMNIRNRLDLIEDLNTESAKKIDMWSSKMVTGWSQELEFYHQKHAKTLI